LSELSRAASNRNDEPLSQCDAQLYSILLERLTAAAETHQCGSTDAAQSDATTETTTRHHDDSVTTERNGRESTAYRTTLSAGSDTDLFAMDDARDAFSARRLYQGTVSSYVLRIRAQIILLL